MTTFDEEDTQLLTSLIERAFFWQRAGDMDTSKRNVNLIKLYYGEAVYKRTLKSLREDKNYVPPILRKEA